MFPATHAGAAGTDVFSITRPQASGFELSGSIPPQLMDTFTTRLRDVVTSGELRATGQVRAEARTWMWIDVWVPADKMQAPAQPFFNVSPGDLYDGARVFGFVTTESGQLVQSYCGVPVRRGASADDVNKEIETASATFMEMYKRLRITASAMP